MLVALITARFDLKTGPQRVLAGGDAYLRFHIEHPGAFHFLAYRNPGATPLSELDELEARVRSHVGELLRRFAVQIDAAIDAGEADLIGMGKPFLANPDLVERLRNNWPLNAWNSKTFYTEGPIGYIDYPICRPHLLDVPGEVA